MQKLDKFLNLKTKHGTVVRVVREHYLRDDIPCHNKLCPQTCSNGPDCIPANVSHILLPDCFVTRTFAEIFELPEFRGILFLQTALHSALHEGNRRIYNRLLAKVHDGKSGCAVVANEFCRDIYDLPEAGEKLSEWQFRMVHRSAEWYVNHLEQQKAVIILTENNEHFEEYKEKTKNVFVLLMKDYLERFWPELRQAQDIYESLVVALESETQHGSANSKDYTDHLSSDILQAGIKSGIYIEGSLRVNKYHAREEAFVQRKGVDSKDNAHDSDVLVSGMKHRNRAIHGDVVVVQLLPQNQWKGKITNLKHQSGSEEDGDSNKSSSQMPSGRVVGIVQRGWRDYVASFPEDQEMIQLAMRGGKVLMIPWDTDSKDTSWNSSGSSLKDHRVIIRIDSWPLDSQYPNGHFVKTLGPIGTLETELQCLLVENTISVGNFSERQLQEMPVNTDDNPWTIDDAEVGKRRDLRETHLVFSIDPKGCEDVDDTLSVRQLKKGYIELGVHIADVSHFVKTKSLTDLEARSRSTTVYLADRRFDMLPAILSSDLCSLIGGVDRYAVSVIWKLKPDTYEVEKVWYGRTIISSAYKMFYEAAQMIHDEEEVGEEEIPELTGFGEEEKRKRLADLKWSVDKLIDIASHLKARRVHEGAVQLEGVEVKVELNEQQEIENLVPKQTLEIHETIAECMIFANHWVARKISEVFPSCALLRHHPLPRQEQFADLVMSARAKNFEIDTSSNKALAESLDQCIDQEDPVYNKILRSLATKAMSNALYFSTGSLSEDQYFHYGLGLDLYTHFTSPIRRYADIIVHRLLMAAISDEPDEDLLGNIELKQLCTHINSRHRSAQNAQKDSQELFQALFFRNKDPEEDPSCTVDAVVRGLRSNGVLVFIPRYGINGAAFLQDKSGLVLTFVDDDHTEWVPGSIERSEYAVTVKTASSEWTYRLFEHITVRITVQPSRVHSETLKFSVVKKSPFKADLEGKFQSSGQGLRTDIVKEVTTADKSKSSSEMREKVVVMGKDVSELQKLYHQTKEKDSLYTFLQNLHELNLSDDR
ncbi:putative DIS3-like exonuclease 1 [Apostichopus japonicus]|uniref:DIS3-like exonuclease 1 n=1 Tax=Stichopus japonicus TaxID=307972 RepID=A0A2G8LA93_STIJA|nr:putative DIS3-like exonuclease 1 [Apostichopus japonicus]